MHVHVHVYTVSALMYCNRLIVSVEFGKENVYLYMYIQYQIKSGTFTCIPQSICTCDWLSCVYYTVSLPFLCMNFVHVYCELFLVHR